MGCRVLVIICVSLYNVRLMPRRLEFVPLLTDQELAYAPEQTDPVYPEPLDTSLENVAEMLRTGIGDRDLSEDEADELATRLIAGDETVGDEFLLGRLRSIHRTSLSEADGDPELAQDLFQIICENLLRRIGEYDPSKHYSSLKHFAIEHAHRAMRDQTKDYNLVYLPVHSREDLVKADTTAEKLYRDLEREPTIEEVASKIGRNPEKLAELYAMRDANQNPEPVERLDDIVDETADTEVEAAKNLRREQLRSLIIKLPDYRTRRVIELLHGLSSPLGRPSTAVEVSDIFNVTRARVYQIQAKGHQLLIDLAEVQEAKAARESTALPTAVISTDGEVVASARRLGYETFGEAALRALSKKSDQRDVQDRSWIAKLEENGVPEGSWRAYVVHRGALSAVVARTIDRRDWIRRSTPLPKPVKKLSYAIEPVQLRLLRHQGPS